jgi:hypothetical protein
LEEAGLGRNPWHRGWGDAGHPEAIVSTGSQRIRSPATNPLVKHLDAHICAHHDASMRTTITLEPDVARLLKDAMQRERRPFKAVLNDALRRGFAPRARRSSGTPYRVTPHRTGLLAGLDPLGFNRLADELDDEALLRKASGR